MPGQYKVYVKGTTARWGPYSLKRAQDFARIGSQTGRPRVVKRGRKKVREYRRGKRVWPVMRAQCRGLTARECPRELRGGARRKRNPYPQSKADFVVGAEVVMTRVPLYASSASARYENVSRTIAHVQKRESGVVLLQFKGSTVWYRVAGRPGGAFSVYSEKRKYEVDNIIPPKAKKNPKRTGTGRYIYPATKTFPVGDAEHQRRALAYVKAGRATPEQVVTVVDWLAKHATDAKVKADAKTALAAWKKTGTGLISDGMATIRRRQRTIRQRNPKTLEVLVTPKRRGWELEPAGEKNYYAYGRGLLLAAAAKTPATGRAKLVEKMAKHGPLVTLKTQAAMEQLARGAKIRPAALGTLESGKAINARVPVRLWKKLLAAETGLQVR